MRFHNPHGTHLLLLDGSKQWKHRLSCCGLSYAEHGPVGHRHGTGSQGQATNSSISLLYSATTARQLALSEKIKAWLILLWAFTDASRRQRTADLKPTSSLKTSLTAVLDARA
jgi:hypothetical protein